MAKPISGLLSNSLLQYLGGSGLEKTKRALEKELKRLPGSPGETAFVDLKPLFRKIDKEYSTRQTKTESDKQKTTDDKSSAKESKHSKNAQPLPERPVIAATAPPHTWQQTEDVFCLKASQELKRVKGEDFRKEKAKKKKSSWKGQGEISMGVNSVQFDSD